ncbi:RICIN domain-containing protein [Streptomyces sp. R11]|uniref:RICIN domain-containing protein n=1 Tax=Streptomyces sp. R11 TaxID=3238625 RepID=A0AB39NCC5_9ACTN
MGRFTMRLAVGMTVAAATAVAGSLSGVTASHVHAATFFNHIKAQHSGKVLSATPVAGGAVREGNPVVQATPRSFDLRQQWVAEGKGFAQGGTVFAYKLRQKILSNSGAVVNGCLDAPNDQFAQAENSNLVVRPCDGTASQKWIRFTGEDPGSGFVRTKNSFNGKHMSILNQSKLEGANLVQSTLSIGTNSKFSVVGVDFVD